MFSADEKCLLFKLRSSMIHVKMNFSSMYQDLTCNLCDENMPQTASHLLNCTFFIKNFPHLDLNNVKFKDLFGKISNQHKATKMFQELISIMEAKEAKETESEKVNASN